ncbi:NAD-dependent epimerase/dehydratase family protein [Nonomuraea sp. NPDC050310]|uniref:NAD-dependent epimerase/dehydratase family protein n=1 Tax=Nonomuraea sp. NPDC050310 TaxID=3154935 RepID=UPI0033D931C7
MRVLVTGASGFVGSHAVAALRAAGHDCRLLVRDPERAARVLGGGDGLVRGDIRDAAAVRRALTGCEAVLHAAADMGVTGRAADLAGANGQGLENVLGQAVELGLDPVVHVSTIAVFVPPAGPRITAASPLASPRNAYGRSKVAGERSARGLGRVTIVYPGGVAGPGQPRLDALNEGIRAGVRQGWPLVPGGVGVIDVRDLADALAACFDGPGEPRRVLLGGRFVTWSEMADLCEAVTGRRIRRYRLPPALLRGLGSTLDLLKKVIPISYPLTRDAAEIMLTNVPVAEGEEVALRPVKDTISDTLRWLAAEGHLKASEIGTLAP